MRPEIPQTAAAPAGWYPDPNERGQRYWDGFAWTEHLAPLAPAATPGPKATTGDWVGGVLLGLLFPIVGLIAGLVYVIQGGERRQVGWLTLGLSCVVFLAYIAAFSGPSGGGSTY